jgi:5'-3' exoribonuclease 2
MNQQRSRRFRASKETAEKVIEIKKLKEEILKKGGVIPPDKESTESFDSNCITPVSLYL